MLPYRMLLEIPPFFQAPIILAIFLYLFAGNLYIFKIYQINYTTAFGLTSHNTIGAFKLFNVATIFCGFFFLCLFFYTQSILVDKKSLLVDFFPSVFYITVLISFILPTNFFYGPQRRYFLDLLCKVFFPFRLSITFQEVFLADGLTSLSKVLADLELIICSIFSHRQKEVYDTTRGCLHSLMTPVVLSFPFLLRVIQCGWLYKLTGQKFPYLVNLLKYATGFPSLLCYILLSSLFSPKRFRRFGLDT
jgi:hypothetical protein